MHLFKTFLLGALFIVISHAAPLSEKSTRNPEPSARHVTSHDSRSEPVLGHSDKDEAYDRELIAKKMFVSNAAGGMTHEPQSVSDNARSKQKRAGKAPNPEPPFLPKDAPKPGGFIRGTFWDTLIWFGITKFLEPVSPGENLQHANPHEEHCAILVRRIEQEYNGVEWFKNALKENKKKNPRPSREGITEAVRKAYWNHLLESPNKFFDKILNPMFDGGCIYLPP